MIYDSRQMLTSHFNFTRSRLWLSFRQEQKKFTDGSNSSIVTQRKKINKTYQHPRSMKNGQKPSEICPNTEWLKQQFMQSNEFCKLEITAAQCGYASCKKLYHFSSEAMIYNFLPVKFVQMLQTLQPSDFPYLQLIALFEYCKIPVTRKNLFLK